MMNIIIPKQVTKILNKMKTLEKKENELMENYNGIVSTCGYGQIPYVGHNTLDKALVINKKRYELWKEIRGYIFGNNTLWQIGISSKYPVDSNDNSNIIHFGVTEIIQMITMELKK